MAPAFVWTRVDGSPALWVIFVRRRTSSDDLILLRVVTGQWGAHVVPAGAASFFRLRLRFLWTAEQGKNGGLLQAGENGTGVSEGSGASFPPALMR
jgi:hypothetical protein